MWAPTAQPSPVPLAWPGTPLIPNPTRLPLAPAPSPLPSRDAWSRRADSGLATAGPESRSQRGKGAHFSWPPTPACGGGERGKLENLLSDRSRLGRGTPRPPACSLGGREARGWSSNYQKPVLGPWGGEGVGGDRVGAKPAVSQTRLAPGLCRVPQVMESVYKSVKWENSEGWGMKSHGGLRGRG